MTETILGIDLGTTNSVVATIDGSGQVVVLENGIGEDITPSAVYFEAGGDVVVGDDAKRMAGIDPGNTVTLIKRQMGTEYPLHIRGQSHTPESISAIILRYLVEATGQHRQAKIVITIPAYFGIAHREATAQAGRIAGFEVLELLAEPVAAAIHYGLDLPGERTVLVYDLGGGTFDTTILKINNGEVDVVVTDGDHKLGGADVDERLQQTVLQRLEAAIPAEDFDDFVDDDSKLGNLMADVEAAKKTLSARSQVDVLVRTATDQIAIKLTRDDLEDACSDLFDKTSTIIDKIIADARAVAGVASIDEVIMVGGSSRIPSLATRLQNKLGKTPRLVDPDLAVAKGAALRAHKLAGSPRLRLLSETRGLASNSQTGAVTPVLPKAVGLLIDDSFDPSGNAQFVEHLITANTPLPASQTTRNFGTILPSQAAVRIQVYEQAGSTPSREITDNRRVLDGELAGIGDLPAGSVIEVTIDVGIDARLTVTASEPVSGKRLTFEAFVEGVVDSAEAATLHSVVSALRVRS